MIHPDTCEECWNLIIEENCVKCHNCGAFICNRCTNGDVNEICLTCVRDEASKEHEWINKLTNNTSIYRRYKKEEKVIEPNVEDLIHFIREGMPDEHLTFDRKSAIYDVVFISNAYNNLLIKYFKLVKEKESK